MTTEEKAQAYDEAVKKAREIAANPNRILQLDDFEELFPGITDESEDERIRKEIIDFIQWAEDRGMTRHDYHQAKRPAVWLAYLEKQKEPIDPFDTKLFQDGVKEGRRLEREDIKKEQKPIEWSEEDNIGWDEAFACVTRAEKAAKNEEELQNAVTAEKWLKEIKFKYYVHPVKQKWSEEDKLHLNNAILATMSEWGKDSCTSKWLKSLPERFNLQPKQEWSEKDEELFNSALFGLKYAYEDLVNHKSFGSAEDVKDAFYWLKYRRFDSYKNCNSRWKPSGEQMQYLLAVINDPNNAGAESCHLILESLHNDLNEL